MKKWLLLIALISANVSAETWKPVGSTEQAELSIDTDSIQQQGNYKQTWIMWNFTSPRENTGDESFPTLKSYKDMYLIDCKNQTMRLAKEVIYADNNGKGTSRDHSEALKNTPFAKAESDSVGGIILKYVCEYKIAPKK